MDPVWNILPDLVTTTALATLTIYHLMIWWGRSIRKQNDRINECFFMNVFSIPAARFILFVKTEENSNNDLTTEISDIVKKIVVVDSTGTHVTIQF